MTIVRSQYKRSERYGTINCHTVVKDSHAMVESMRRQLRFDVLHGRFDNSSVRERRVFDNLGNWRLGRCLHNGPFLGIAGHGRPTVFLDLGFSSRRHIFGDGISMSCKKSAN